jgi:electron transfer flavoprotein alpha/beta subunit
VLAIGNAVVSRLRVPTLTDRLAQRGKPIAVLSAADLGVAVAEELSREACALTGLEAIDRARPGVIIAGETPRAKAQALFAAHLKTRVEEL